MSNGSSTADSLLNKAPSSNAGIKTDRTVRAMRPDWGAVSQAARHNALQTTKIELLAALTQWTGRRCSEREP